MSSAPASGDGRALVVVQLNTGASSRQSEASLASRESERGDREPESVKQCSEQRLQPTGLPHSHSLDDRRCQAEDSLGGARRRGLTDIAAPFTVRL